MIGRIYIIKNSVNNKVYIGKTILTVEDRFKEHLYNAFRKSDDGCFKYNYKIYTAIRKYGADKFYVETIGEFNVEELNSKEIFYIEKYDSYKNGYNSTLGGDGNLREFFTDKEKRLIIELYKSGMTLISIAKLIPCSTKSVARLIQKELGVRNIATESKEIFMFDKKTLELKRKFNSVGEAYRFLVESGYRSGKADFYHYIKKSCEEGIVAFGYKWSTTINGYDEREDKNENKEAVDKPVKIGIAGPKVHKKREKALKTGRCIVCGAGITCNSTTGMCNSCANVIAKGKNAKPSKEELKKLLDSGIQTKEIAELFGRSASTVSTWKKKYEL